MNDISIVMPVKNGIPFIEASLEYLKRVAGSAEVLVVDDGSTDGTFEYCVSFLEHFPNLRVERNPGQGICAALNHGINLSRGSWIARVDVDDEYDLSRFIHQINIVNSTSSILVFSDYGFYADGRKFLGLMPSGIFSIATKLSLITGRRTAHPSAIFLKEAFIAAGGYLADDFPAEDLSLWLRMQSLGPFATTGTELLRYRLSSSSTSALRRAEAINQKSRVLQKYPLDQMIFREAIKGLSKTLDSYGEFDCAPERRVLHLFDILKYSKDFKVPLARKTRILILGNLVRLESQIAVLKLVYYARRRNHFRKRNLKIKTIRGNFKGVRN